MSNDDKWKWLKIIILIVLGLGLLIFSVYLGADATRELTYYH